MMYGILVDPLVSSWWSGLSKTLSYYSLATYHYVGLARWNTYWRCRANRKLACSSYLISDFLYVLCKINYMSFIYQDVISFTGTLRCSQNNRCHASCLSSFKVTFSFEISMTPCLVLSSLNPSTIGNFRMFMKAHTGTLPALSLLLPTHIRLSTHYQQ